MIIYRSWDGGDMANSDTYWPTLKGVIADVRKTYGIKGPIKLDADGDWEGRADPEVADGRADDVHIQRLNIELTREGLCHALKYIPNR
jgi:hypothetical protein